MCADFASRPRVLLGNLEPMVLLGMRRALSDEGMEVLVEATGWDELITCARSTQPNAIVIGLDGHESRQLGARLREVAPRSKVIMWSRDEREMEVLDRGGTEPRRVRVSLTDALREELAATTISNQGA